MQSFNQPKKYLMERFIERTRIRFIQAAKLGETFRTVVYERVRGEIKNFYWVTQGSASLGVNKYVYQNPDNWSITDRDAQSKDTLRNSRCRMLGESFVENGIPGVLIQIFVGDQVTLEKYWFEKDRMMVNKKGVLIRRKDDEVIRLTFSLN